MRLLWILGFTVAIASADDLPRQALEILSTNCIGCHNGELKIAQLDLTTREGMLKGGERGEALSPGDPLKSRLYRAAAHLDQPSMPPGKKLQDWQVEVIKRLSSGWIFQGNYTWSKTLGDYDGEDTALTQSFRTLRNLSLDKKRLSYDRLHVFRSNGIWELPFGPGKLIGNNAHRVVGKIIGGWQTGSIFNAFSGAPVNFTAVNAFNTVSGATPVAVGSVPTGAVQRVGNGVVYFSGYQHVVDPCVAQITTLQNLQSRSTLRAIADASGKLLLVNGQPGQLGMQQNMLRGPGTFRLDVNLIKNISVRERYKIQIRADAINLLNKTQWGNPVTNINSATFGRITTATGNRTITFNARIDF